MKPQNPRKKGISLLFGFNQIGDQSVTRANRIFQRMFNYVLDTHGLKLDQDGQPRTTYSLRHYALQTRLNKSGGKVNIYDLARNAGTSVNQLERFYLKRMKVNKKQRENLNRFDSTE